MILPTSGVVPPLLDNTLFCPCPLRAWSGIALDLVRGVAYPIPARTKPGPLFPSRAGGPQCAELSRVRRGMLAPMDNLCTARSHQHRCREGRQPEQAAHGVRGSQPNVGPRLHRDLSALNQRAPEPIQAVKQKQPGRAHERLRLRDPNLGTMVVAKHLCRPSGVVPIHAPDVITANSTRVRQRSSVADTASMANGRW